MRRASLLAAAAVTVVVGFPARPALAQDSESGWLVCPGREHVTIVERTSAGLTTVTIEGTPIRRIVKQDWSTTSVRTSLQAANWTVTTTGSMDHTLTGAFCTL